jgi:hypothetical protein
MGECDRDSVGVFSSDTEANSGGVPECRSIKEGIERIGVGGIPE